MEDAPGLDWCAEEDGSRRSALGHLTLYVWPEDGSWWFQAEDAAAIRFIMRGFPDQIAAQHAARFYARGYLDRDDLVTGIHAVAHLKKGKHVAPALTFDSAL
jgi:hypothetical protein